MIDQVSVIMHQLIREHGPASILATVMILTGSLVGKNGTNDAIMLSDYWCKQIPIHTPIKSDIVGNVSQPTQDKVKQHHIPDSLNQFTLATSILTPIIPVLANFKTAWFKINIQELSNLDLKTLPERLWPDSSTFSTRGDSNKWSKLSLLKVHVLGQATVYAVSEVLSHYLTNPNKAFWEKCNITRKECLRKAKLHSVYLMEPTQMKINFTRNLLFCPKANNNNNTSDIEELYKDLHYFPNLYCMLLGASAMTILFYVALYFCRMETKEYFGMYSSFTRALVVLSVAIYLTLFIIYTFYLYKISQMIQLIAIFGGFFIQLFVLYVIMDFEKAQRDFDFNNDDSLPKGKHMGWTVDSSNTKSEMELQPIKP